MARFLFVTTISSTASAFLLPFATMLRASGNRVDLASSDAASSSACVDAFDAVWNIGWSRRPRRLIRHIAAALELQKLVKREGYDVVHVHTPIAAFLSRVALRKIRNEYGIKVIYTAHGFHFYRGGRWISNAFYYFFEWLAGRWTDYLVVINEEDRLAAIHMGSVADDRIRFMPGIGVDTGAYASDTPINEMDDVRRELGVAHDQRIFVMVAEFNPGKCHDVALRAFSRLADRRAVLLFLGTGPLHQSMQRLARALGVQDRVRFLGFRKDVPRFVRSSLAMVLPSRREGLPRAVLESLSMGVPVIGTAIRGIRDVIDDSCGRLFEVGDVDGLSRHMRWFLDNEHAARALGHEGRVRIQRGYDLQAICKLHAELYRDALGVAGVLRD